MLKFADNTMICGRKVTNENWWLPNMISMKAVSDNLFENPAPVRRVQFMYDIMYDDQKLATKEIHSTEV